MSRIKHILFGDYDYSYLCTPQWPYCRKQKRASPMFFGRDAHLGLLTAAVMGAQHALAMTAGLITPPLLIGFLANDPSIQAYLIQAALLVCAITTAIQVTGIGAGTRFPVQLGAGMLSVMGVSFASVPVYQSTITILKNQGYTFEEAYGKMLGTTAVCAVLPAILSFVPYKAMRRIFPPVVTGTTIILIGINLIQVGMQAWGGGAFCGQNTEHLPVKYENCTIPSSTGGTTTAACYNLDVVPNCNGNGDALLPYGSPEYVGLGFLVFVTIIFLEVFGSPFFRNASVILALLVGYLVAAVTTDSYGRRYVTWTEIQNAPVVTFLWVQTFPLGFYAPAVLPLLIVFCITSIETIGDVTATAEASKLKATGLEHMRRIKGGLLNDGFSSIFSALGTSMPLTTFAQNNGVIALTNVASRQAGWAAAVWLLLLGIFGKFGGWVLSIPDCVLGGMTTFLFANVIASGIKMVISEGSLHRRNRFIMVCALALGIGVTLVPAWAENALWPADPSYSSGLAGLRTAVLLVLEEGFTLGTVVALILNLIFPEEAPESAQDPSYSTHEAGHLPVNFDSAHHSSAKDAMMAPGHMLPPERMDADQGLYGKV